jgi:hypothetical protein
MRFDGNLHRFFFSSGSNKTQHQDQIKTPAGACLAGVFNTEKAEFTSA